MLSSPAVPGPAEKCLAAGASDELTAATRATADGLHAQGALFWTHVLAIFCDIATNSNPALTLFNQVTTAKRPPATAHHCVAG
jgi:hypothetical protein